MSKVLSNTQTHQGFTLIELMVTVSILAIIAAIAVPSYREQIKQNSEEQGRQRAYAIAIELSSWRSKKLSYAGFKPKNQGCTGGSDYCYSTGNSLYVPLGSTSTNYKYLITVVDGSNFLALTNSNAEGRSWRLKASPNTSNNLLTTADTYYMDSLGRRCAYDHTVASGLSLSAATIACSGTGINSF